MLEEDPRICAAWQTFRVDRHIRRPISALKLYKF